MIKIAENHANNENFRKEEFVEMYNEHVAPVAEDAGEFSSDDEVGVFSLRIVVPL